jgi:hypothetical protein
MGKLILIVIIFFVLFSCSNQQVKNQIVSDTVQLKLRDVKKEISKSELYGKYIFHDSLVVSKDSTEIIYWSRNGKWLIGYENPLLIKGNHWYYHSYSLPANFCPDSVLKHFFYGRYYKIMSHEFGDNDTDSFVCWKRPEIRKSFFLGRPFAEDTSVFPFDQGNETRFLDTLKWTQPDGKKYLLFSFSTCVNSIDFEGGMNGHYDPGALGLALFVWDMNQWKFISFSPDLDFTGNWSRADAPEVSITGNSSFLILVGDQGSGPGCPRFYWNSFYVVKGNSFISVMEKKPWQIEGYGHPTEWSTKIIPEQEMSLDSFPDLNLVSEGILSVDDSDIVGKDFAIPNSEKYLKQKGIFKFKQTKNIEFKNGKYTVTKVQMKVDTTYTPE